mmetsp:Transcript_28497/g.72629  ORF Transcript_28497/g.72629 Transcript_28497/m.72629 type:complete len:491 (+) Transcript_28497:2108-3580(+)|eukprot:CAMPEP_0113869848 /NCGR_PEP_ID=MMETSP0780_2-20120614/1761_1 /TAXON_ID=652834 /ORGANISM="Palpitomonas bilix" /LENGTH=490 /DNA_ID=CAMNT_0000855065 /DNA_START=35 /DNA_END=1507 /DNA_ORIENTATION=+ /assembly_acc=CAM_ASM_000599
MRFTHIAALLLATLALSAAVEKENGVLVLNGDNFESEVSKAKFMVVEFYAPWCGHCKKLAPEYEQAAATFAREGIDVVLAKVDATEDNNRAISSKYEVRGYPTLKIFRGNTANPEPYEGPRDAAGIVNYLKKRTGPAVKDLGSDEKVLTRTIEANRVVVVGFFRTPLTASKAYEHFTTAANSLRDDFEFVSVTDDAIAEKYGAKVPGMILFKKFDEKKVVFEGEMISSDALRSFAVEAGRPWAIRAYEDAVDQSDIDRAMSSEEIKMILFINGGDRNRANMYTKRASTVAKGYKGKAIFIVADGVRGAGNIRPDIFGLSGKVSELPYLVALDSKNNIKYVNPNTEEKVYKAAAIREFTDAVIEGDVEAFLKSEEEPADNDGPVKVVTGKTFNDIVMDEEKDVLIEMYAPWCGHCKQLAPTYEKLGEKFAKDNDVVIAKIDATANDIPVPSLQARGYPTLKFVTKKNKVIDYSGERTLEEFSSFIKKNKSK